jgi:hypothetical protein
MFQWEAQGRMEHQPSQRLVLSPEWVVLSDPLNCLQEYWPGRVLLRTAARASEPAQ